MDSNPQPEFTPRPWLRLLCYATIAGTFALIAVGGKVTSFEYGMAIPQGWTTGGVISFLAPLEHWFYDTDKFWEHSHRIMGTLVGFLTIGMLIWLLVTQRDRPWLQFSGFVMLAMVGFQGYLGATRVNDNSLAYAFVHGIGGQLILCSWVVIAAALSPSWLSRLGSIAKRQAAYATPRLRWAVRLLLVLLLIQLTLGSAVRHFKSDKAIPDFPLNYGQLLPPMSQDALDEAYIAYYAERAGVAPEDSGITNRTPQGELVISVADVHLHFAHRLGAYAVLAFGLGLIVVALRREQTRATVVAPCLVFGMFLGTQVALGVMTVLSETDPFMATLHQATGAALIGVATWLAVRIHLAEYAAAAVMTDKKTGTVFPVRTTPANPVTA